MPASPAPMEAGNAQDMMATPVASPLSQMSSGWTSAFWLNRGVQLMRHTLCSRDGFRACENKSETSAILNGLGLQTPAEVEWLVNAEGARACLDRFLAVYTFPLVVKPARASCGLGVHTHITSREQALAAMAALSPDYQHVLLQECVTGSEYRVFLLDGVVSEVIRRIPTPGPRSPVFVTGDGVSSIRSLVNELRRTSEPTVDVNPVHIRFHGYSTVDQVPRAGEVISVQGVLRGATFERLQIARHCDKSVGSAQSESGVISPLSPFARACEAAGRCMPRSNRIYSIDLMVEGDQFCILEMDYAPLLMESVFSNPRVDWSFWKQVLLASLLVCVANVIRPALLVFLLLLAAVSLIKYPGPLGSDATGYTRNTVASLLISESSTNITHNATAPLGGCQSNASFDPHLDFPDSQWTYPILLALVIAVTWCAVFRYGWRVTNRPSMLFLPQHVVGVGVTMRRPDVSIEMGDTKIKKKHGPEEHADPRTCVKVTQTTTFWMRVHYLGVYFTLFIEAWQLCGAAFLPAAGWHVSNGTAPWLSDSTKVMAVPYLVFQSLSELFPAISFDQLIPAFSFIDQSCAGSSKVWVASLCFVLGIGVILPLCLVIFGMGLWILTFVVSMASFCCALFCAGLQGEADDVENHPCDEACVMCCFKEVSLFRAVEDLEGGEAHAIELPWMCGGYGMLLGPAFFVVSLGLGPFALSVMSALFSTWSCSYKYTPALVTRSIATHGTTVTGVECWSELHLLFAITAAITFVPVYLLMVYFNMNKKCGITPRPEFTLHTATTTIEEHFTPDPLDHVRQLVPGMLVRQIGRDNQLYRIKTYKGDDKYDMQVYSKAADERILDENISVTEILISNSTFFKDKLSNTSHEQQIMEPGFLYNSILESKQYTCCCCQSLKLRENLKEQGGVYVASLPRGPGYCRVRYNPLTQLVSLQIKVVVAALTSFFGKSTDGKRLLLLVGLLIANAVLLVTTTQNPSTSDATVNLFQLTCLWCCLVSTLVATVANFAGTAAVVSWLVGVGVVSIVGGMVLCFKTMKTARARALTNVSETEADRSIGPLTTNPLWPSLNKRTAAASKQLATVTE